MLICYLLCLCISCHSIVSDSYAVPMFHPSLVQLPINISKEWSLLHFYTYHYMQKKSQSLNTDLETSSKGTTFVLFSLLAKLLEA